MSTTATAIVQPLRWASAIAAAAARFADARSIEVPYVLAISRVWREISVASRFCSFESGTPTWALMPADAESPAARRTYPQSEFHYETRRSSARFAHSSDDQSRYFNESDCCFVSAVERRGLSRWPRRAPARNGLDGPGVARPAVPQQ